MSVTVPGMSEPAGWGRKVTLSVGTPCHVGTVEPRPDRPRLGSDPKRLPNSHDSVPGLPIFRECRLCRRSRLAQSVSGESARSHNGPGAAGPGFGGHAPWHFLNFLPLPHQHGSLRPTFSFSDLTMGRGAPVV